MERTSRYRQLWGAALAVVAGAGLWANTRPGALAARLLRLAEGNHAYTAAAYGDAEVHYRAALAGEVPLAAARYNLGNALQQQGRYAEAIGQYRGVLHAGAPQAEALAWANLGQAYYHTGELSRSLAAFRRALLLSPHDDQTRQDFLFVRAAILQKQQSPPPAKKGTPTPAKNEAESRPGSDEKKDDAGQQQGAAEQQLSAKTMEELLGQLSENENQVRNKMSGPRQQGRKTASDEKDY
ncbi:tetratricopeptide repeat protein [Hymenobacter sp. BT523]|uniref:tetratricopeptide repeat protein n=1 Tax=Hymenobacter sp. BT523 TaxID=2795725 RepID=UPI0018ED8848|nr:tetratricopeptide repeat protein [Hymenobacter sp. BT523]MBJ6110393.1 tetratricopeptide repeat protein [Hymenobacter sp. BT523]